MSEKAPVARRHGCWWEVQKKYLKEIVDLANQYYVPLLIAGDLFHTPVQPPKLVNAVITELRGCARSVLTIPGQHDLVHHSLGDIHNTSYFTLAQAGVIRDLSRKPTFLYQNIAIRSAPWGVPLPKAKKVDKHVLSVLLAHQYVWTAGHKFPNAQKEAKLSECKNLKGYDAAFFGDNHSGFDSKVNGVPVMNCGAMIRRRIDERNYYPSVGLLCRNEKTKRVHIVRHYLDTRGDQLYLPQLDALSSESDSEALQEIVNAMIDREMDQDDFLEQLRHVARGLTVSRPTRSILMSIINSISGGKF